jgi:mannose-1-phosphate guanylyltransferase/mannose-6-phosphate isomerase
VANVEHLGEIASQLDGPAQLIGEPVARNTAPAVAAASYLAKPDDVLVVLPADHHIADQDAFVQALTAATDAATEGFLVTFGIVPTRPETGYGYIVKGESRSGGFGIFSFVEKPDHAKALRLIEEGAFWNGGMFAFRAGVMVAELEEWSPAVAQAAKDAVATSSRVGDVVVLGEEFSRAEALSIDVAVMEKTQLGVVVPLDAGWSDAGSWESLYELGRADDNGNVIIGDVHATDVFNSYLRSEGPQVAVLGVEDIVVVATRNAVLVTRRDRAQDVKTLVEQMQEEAPQAGQ